MSILSKIFGGGHHNTPMKAAQPYFQNAENETHKNYDPYALEGREASTNLNQTYKSLMEDPQAFIDKITAGYEPSKQYQFNKDLLTKELRNTAAAGGVAGTPMDQLNQASQVQNLLSQDQQQYFQNALGVFKQGLAGQEGTATRGYDATKGINDVTTGSQLTQGKMAFDQTQQERADKTGIISAITKALGAGAGAFFSGPQGMALMAALGLSGGGVGPTSGTKTRPWSNPG